MFLGRGGQNGSGSLYLIFILEGEVEMIKLTGRDAKVAGGTVVAVFVGQKIISKLKDFGLFGGHDEEEQEEEEEEEVAEEVENTAVPAQRAQRAKGTISN